MTSDLTVTAVYHNHTFQKVIESKDSTCIEQGYIKCECECGAINIEEMAINYDNHIGSTVVKNKADATCTKQGYTGDVHCEACDAVLVTGEVISATGHSYGEWNVVLNPTCEEKGQKEKICSVCEYVKITSIDALGHDFDDEYTIDIEHSCTEDGSQSKHCSRCENVSDVVVIPAHGHNPGTECIENKVEATTKADGKCDTVVYCQICNSELSRITTVIPKLAEATVQGYLYDAFGNPIKNAKVELHSRPRVVYTDENGYFIFPEVEEGNHTLYVFNGKDEEVCEIAIDVNKGGVLSETLKESENYKITTNLSDYVFEVEASENEINILIPITVSVVTTTTAGALFVVFWKRNRKIYGTVLNKTGNPVANALVKLSGMDMLETNTDENGYFEFKNLKYGEYKLNVYNDLSTLLYEAMINTRMNSAEEAIVEIESLCDATLEKKGNHMEVNLVTII